MCLLYYMHTEHRAKTKKETESEMWRVWENEQRNGIKTEEGTERNKPEYGAETGARRGHRTEDIKS